MKLFTVYEIDVDDQGCARLHVNTDISYTPANGDRLATLIDALDDSGALADLVTSEEEANS